MPKRWPTYCPHCGENLAGSHTFCPGCRAIVSMAGSDRDQDTHPHTLSLLGFTAHIDVIVIAAWVLATVSLVTLFLSTSVAESRLDVLFGIGSFSLLAGFLLSIACSFRKAFISASLILFVLFAALHFGIDASFRDW